jgi:spore maturation protein CgeB
VKVLKEVLNMGLSLHVYGNHWGKFLTHPLLTIHKPVLGKSFFQTLKKYRVQLNIMRVHNPDSHNMRSIEIPGCGGIMLAPRTTDHVLFFEEGKEAFFYTNTESLVSQAKEILKMDSQKINQIRIAAREKVLSEFSYSKLVHKFIS